MLCEQRNGVPHVISVCNCKLKYGNQARKATYSIPTKWLKKIKVGIIEFIASPGVRSKALKPKPLVTFNVPSGVNVTFWPRRIYDGIYDGRRISRRKTGYFVSVTSYSDNFRSKNLVGHDESRCGKFVRNKRRNHNCERNNAHRAARNEENVFTRTLRTIVRGNVNSFNRGSPN